MIFFLLLPPILITVLSVAIIVGIYLFLIMPRVKDPADMYMLSTSYAHRGLWNNVIPENSLPAFSFAAQNGYGIEVDIQLSKDKQVMIFHDRNLKRMCGVDKKLSDLTCRELKSLRLLGTDLTIPTLSEVLELIDGRVPLLIELKSGEWDTELCEKVAPILDKYRGAFSVESFDPRLLAWFKKYRQRYARGQLVTKTKRCEKLHETFVSFCLSKLLLNVISRPDFVVVDIRQKNSLMVYVCRKLFKIPIFIWTVKTKGELASCKADGYNVIFEKTIPD